jgi:signal transduction histidine kinase
LNRFGYTTQSASNFERLGRMRGPAFRHLELAFLSSTFPGLELEDKREEIFGLLPFVPIVQIGGDAGRVENRTRGVFVLDTVNRPIDSDKVGAAVQVCQSTHQAFQAVLERKLFQNQARYLEEPVARIIHDLNNQITGLKGGIDLLDYAVDMIQDLESQSKFNRYMEQFIKPSLNQIEQMVRNWRQLRDNRLRAPVETRLADLVYQAVNLVAEPSQQRMITVLERGRELKFRSQGVDYSAYPENEPPLKALANPEQMILGLSHIIQNALEAVEDKSDGSIQIAISDGPEGMCVVEVFDNGPGIDENDYRQVWRSFYSTKGKSRNGLGMSIAKQVIDKYQGQIECVRSPLGGAGIRILVPRDKKGESNH